MHNVYVGVRALHAYVHSICVDWCQILLGPIFMPSLAHSKKLYLRMYRVQTMYYVYIG